jgi:hypothetical protein
VDFPVKTPIDKKTKEQNAALKKKYKVEAGLPYIVFADASGKQLGTYRYEEGGAAKWIKNAEAQFRGKAKGK